MRRAGWEETVALFQMVARGVLGYAPLVGTMYPRDLHAEDAALQRLLLHGLHVRVSAEHMGLLVSRKQGGLQAPSMVEAVVSAVPF